MSNNSLQALFKEHPGPFHCVPSTDGVDETFEVRCKTTDARLIATYYWNDGAAHEVITESVVFALNEAKEGSLVERGLNDLPISNQFLFARYPGPFYSEFLDDEHDPTHAVMCRTTKEIVINESGFADSVDIELIAAAVADALNILLSTVTPQSLAATGIRPLSETL